MTTSPHSTGVAEVTAIGARFTDEMLYIALSDGREIGVPLSRYKWLASATPEQRNQWSIEPSGYAIYWDVLDDGLEVAHLLTKSALS